MGGRGKGSRGNLRQESCGGPDADSGHAHQDRGKRVRQDPLLDLLGELRRRSDVLYAMLRDGAFYQATPTANA